jgi:hypothetical protein
VGPDIGVSDYFCAPSLCAAASEGDKAEDVIGFSQDD